MARQAPNNPDQLRQIQMSTRELTTQQQVSTLLNIAGMMWSALQGAPRNPFDASEVTKPEKTEGWIAAENCFIRTCAAIERIVDDTQRFDFSFQKKMEEDYAAAMKMNLEYIQAHRDAAIEQISPHHVCNPTLVKLADGSYMAVLGNPNSPNDSIAGVGRSPQEALEAFDLAFKGLTEKIKNESQTKSVDQRPNPETPEPPKRRRIYPKRRPEDGQDGQSGGAGKI